MLYIIFYQIYNSQFFKIWTLQNYLYVINIELYSWPEVPIIRAQVIGVSGRTGFSKYEIVTLISLGLPWQHIMWHHEWVNMGLPYLFGLQPKKKIVNAAKLLYWQLSGVGPGFLKSELSV